MPHSWASAECVRFLRHMLVLEDNQSLRLLEGITAADLLERQSFTLAHTPTRFGRVSLTLEPEGKRGWQMKFIREGGYPPARLELPATLQGSPVTVEGAEFRAGGNGKLLVDLAASEWTARWTS